MVKISILLPDLRGGGAERVFVTLANYFISMGYSVEFIVLNKTGEFIEICDRKITFYDLKCSSFNHAVLPLRTYIVNNKPTVILAGMWPLTVYATLANLLAFKQTKVVVTDHSILSKSPLFKRLSKRVFMRLSIGLLYPFAHARVGVSNGVCSDISKLGYGLKNITTIFNPIEKFKTDNSNNLNNKTDTPYILAVGRMKAVKGFDSLINAYAQVERSINEKLVILGDGELKEALVQQVCDLGLQDKVVFPGFCDNPYLWYRGASLFCLSSINEGFGNVIVEAMQCGVPVVSTDCESGPREILENGKYGKLVPVGDAEALARAMFESLNAQHDTEALKRRAQDFSVEKIALQYLNVMFPEGSDKIEK